MKLIQRATMLLVSVVVMFGAVGIRSHATAPPPLPNPVLFLVTQEYYTAGGTDFVRYRYDVMNKDAYPAEMFAPAPGLPPCGANKNSSRSWVDIFDSRGKRLYGFCAL